VLSEKRYLLKKTFSVNDIEIPYKKVEIKEYYTYISKCKSIKYKKINNTFLKIIKSKRDYKKIEIDKDVFVKNYKKRLSHIIKKDVYAFEKSALVCIYKKNLNGLMILKLLSEDDEKIFKPYIKEQIIYKDRYDDMYLSLYGNPLSDDKNVHFIMKRLKDNEGKNMKNIIKKDMPVDSAVRIKLYELFLKLEQDRFELLKDMKNRANLLSSYRKRLRKIVDILKEYEDCFDDELVKKVEENLKYIYKKTSVDVKLNSIKVNLKNYKKCLDTDEYVKFLKKEDSSITKEVKNFLNFLQTREYAIILKQLELLIKESSIEVDDTKSDTIIKEAMKKTLKKRYKKVEKSIKKYIDCEDADSFSKILNKIKKLDTLSSEFGFLSKSKIYHSRKRVLSQLSEKIDKFLKILNNIEIAKSTIKEASSVECLMSKLEKERKKSLKSLKKSIKDFRNSKEFFIS